MTDLFDYVDKNDQIIGQTTYDDARSLGRIIRVAHNWIINDQGKILFQFRAAHKKSMPRRFDASTGGKVDAGESYDSAVTRETKEELGIETNPIYLDKIYIDQPEEYKFVSIFYTRHNGPFTGWEAEAEHLEWMSVGEYRDLNARFPYLFCGSLSLNVLINKLGLE